MARSFSPVWWEGRYENGVPRCKVDDFGIGEGRRGILAQKGESEYEGQSQLAVAHRGTPKPVCTL